ncbi:hypothetical protein DEM26_20120 [Thioclava sp. NG1]|nr:hypothetical protein DEM26_20120 [Thioclava sp. NG1]
MSTAALTKQGALASELKGLNAAHASPTALANAAPNSQVGRIAAYKAAVLATGELDQQLADARQTLSELQSQVARTPDAVEADIDALDPTAPDYRDQLAALQSELDASTAYETELTSAQQAVSDLEAQAGDYRSPSDIQADIDALDPTVADYQTQLAALQSELDGAQAYDQQLAQAQQSLSDLQSQTLRSPDAIQADLDALDATDPANADQIATLQAELEASQTYQAELASAQQSVSQLEAEVAGATQEQQDALLSASNGRELSPEALAYLNELLGLPAPDTSTQDAVVDPIAIITAPSATPPTNASD